MRAGPRLTRVTACAVACAVVLLASACGSAGKNDTSKTSGTVPPATHSKAPNQPSVQDVSMPNPPPLKAPLLSSDVLVYSQDTLSPETIAAIKAIKTKSGQPAITDVEPISMGSFFVDEQEFTYAAVDPATFRRFTPPGTAQTQAVWDRVAGGEVAVNPAIAKDLHADKGYFKLGNEAASPTVHIGAYAQILDPTYARQIDAVVNEKWGEKLGRVKDNALIVSMGSPSPQSILKQLKKEAGSKASVQILGPNFDTGVQTAVLTGGSVARAVGHFNYTPHSDGTVAPDPRWVSGYIRSEEVPIIGRVTCNKVMLPQLIAALNEVVTRGLSSKIYHYDGCYVPRFINHNPADGLSFHTFGTAIDLNAAQNGRGTAGQMDRQVVAIFEKWGFEWGGNWHYTDPMHFELAELKHVSH
jgi:hypothetical protein